MKMKKKSRRRWRRRGEWGHGSPGTRRRRCGDRLTWLGPWLDGAPTHTAQNPGPDKNRDKGNSTTWGVGGGIY